VARASASFAVLLALVLASAGCGEHNVILPDGAAKTVTRLVSQKTGFHPTDVNCPSGVDAKVGQQFDCHFTGPEGPYVAHMTVQSVDGTRVEFQIQTAREPNSGQ
jgi:uncharacterized protein DUF4333